MRKIALLPAFLILALLLGAVSNSSSTAKPARTVTEPRLPKGYQVDYYSFRWDVGEAGGITVAVIKNGQDRACIGIYFKGERGPSFVFNKKESAELAKILATTDKYFQKMRGKKEQRSDEIEIQGKTTKWGGKLSYAITFFTEKYTGFHVALRQDIDESPAKPSIGLRMGTAKRITRSQALGLAKILADAPQLIRYIDHKISFDR
jgi:hypothetical protein